MILLRSARHRAAFSQTQQLDKLVRAAESTGLHPLYCFFNFPSSNGQFDGPNVCKHKYRAPSFWGCSLAFPDQVKNAQSIEVTKLKRVMHPWHLLVCEAANIGLLSVATRFVKEKGQRDDVDGPRDLPTRVTRLMEMSEQRRRPDYRSYLDDAFWQGDSDTPDDVLVLMVVQDLRD
jgi:hypothetical protein